MAVPRRKVSPSRRGMRRSQQGLSVPGIAVDKQTKSVHRSHHVDLKTGMYRGKQVLFNDAEDEAGDDSED